MMKLASLAVAVMLGFVLQAPAQQGGNSAVLVLDAGQTGNGTACLMPPPQVPTPPAKQYPLPRCPVQPEHYLLQGKRSELRVYNRRFLNDYNITIDAVTQLATGPQIRNLNEAENLTLGAPSFATIPPSKGGPGGLTARTATEILFQLVDETMASQPQTDLDSEHVVIQRELAKIQAQVEDFRESYRVVRGDPRVTPTTVVLGNALGSPDVQSIWASLQKQLSEVESVCGPPCAWRGAGPYTNEQEFRDLNIRVQDLVTAVKTLGARLSATDLQTKLRNLVTVIAQYESDFNTFRGNAQASRDAVNLALRLDSNFRTGLRRMEMKAFLLEKLKGPDSKPVLGEAELNELLNSFKYRDGTNTPDPRWTYLHDLATAYLTVIPNVTEFRIVLRNARTEMEVNLPTAIINLNSTQGKLLNRVNEIYDRSEVREPLPKQIDLRKHSGNLIVYYTIRRIENFQRYTIEQVPSSTAVQADGEGVAIPTSKGSAQNSAPVGAAEGTPSTSSTSSNTAHQAPDNLPDDNVQNRAAPNQGVVVAKGSFEVHDVYHANVVAAVAFSTLQDQSIAKQPQPQSCAAKSGTPDTNCFSPLISSSFVWSPIVGLDYYFQPRDTFPRTHWLCSEHPWQCFGIMGAASVTKANNYFLGGFFEPVLGVQFGAGANFGIRSVLQDPFKPDVAVDISGNFPTHDERATGAFLSAGLDLGIFRKIFGKVTGIGTSASGTSGK